jgi:S1-C subfamily serine protease
MPAEKVVVSAEEIERTVPEPTSAPVEFKPLPSPIPVWARVLLCVLVPVLPLLCIVALVLKLAARGQVPRVRHAIASLLTTLLAISGLFTTVASVLAVFLIPMPAVSNSGLPSLDERTDFPAFTTTSPLSSTEISDRFKPLVIVVSPAVRLWNHQNVAGSSFGAGVLLQATHDGYLFATANHVVVHGGLHAKGSPSDVMVTTAAGIWSSAQVVASSSSLDLALLWVPRHSGSARFVQPIADVADGEDVFVIGHPEGLNYTLTTGIVSGLRDKDIQISAAISPGNSGGPVYDVYGRLLGIVSATFDRNRDLNAENLGFAARAALVRDTSFWTFYGNGRALLDDYLKQISTLSSAALPSPGKVVVSTQTH